MTRFEAVEWCYDGLGGSIIKWTMENGSPKDHPSLLAFVVGRDGKSFSLLDNGQQYQAGSLVKWAEEQLEAYEKAHPSTRLPFQRGHVDVLGEGTEEEVVCAELNTAREAKQPILLYFGRSHFDSKDKKAKKQNKLSRKFEKGTLNSKTAAKEAKGWALIRLDVSEPMHRALADSFGVKAAPELLMWLPGQDEPQVLGRRVTGPGLAALLKKRKTK